MTTSQRVKLALKRDQSVPPGVAAPMHLDCPCGTTVPVPEPFTSARVECPTCGTTYDGAGWIV